DIVASSAAALVSERTYKGHHRNKSTPTSSEKSENRQVIDFIEIFRGFLGGFSFGLRNAADFHGIARPSLHPVVSDC
nr:hypothetical protein [Agrobacterium sp. rho-8.1]